LGRSHPVRHRSRFIVLGGALKGAIPALDIGGQPVLKRILIYDVPFHGLPQVIDLKPEIDGPDTHVALRQTVAASRFSKVKNSKCLIFRLWRPERRCEVTVSGHPEVANRRVHGHGTLEFRARLASVTLLKQLSDAVPRLLEVAGQFASLAAAGLVAQLSVFLQRLRDFFELGSNVWVQSHRRDWRAIQNRFRNHASGLATEGQNPCHHRVKHHAERKQAVRASNSSPRTCSGDMYEMVPIAVPSRVRCSGSLAVGIAERFTAPAAGVSFARPKSKTLACPWSVTKMLAGLMSRWTIPLACAASSASAISIASCNVSSSGS
jgi:hypothetical protein